MQRSPVLFVYDLARGQQLNKNLEYLSALHLSLQHLELQSKTLCTTLGNVKQLKAMVILNTKLNSNTPNPFIFVNSFTIGIRLLHSTYLREFATNDASSLLCIVLLTD